MSQWVGIPKFTCPRCEAEAIWSVTRTNWHQASEAVIRTRQCRRCGHAVSTEEKITDTKKKIDDC
jgi:transcription elongation factor Elf1